MGKSSVLHVAFLDVGQGDSAVLWNGETDEALIVDCVNAVAVLDLLRHKRVRLVKAVLVTHLHRDHYEGLVALLNNCPRSKIDCEGVYFSWVTDLSRKTQLLDDGDGHSGPADEADAVRRTRRKNLYSELIAWSQEESNKKRYHRPDELPEHLRNVVGMEIEFLHPHKADWGLLGGSNSLNNFSVVLRVSSGGSRVLLTGDLEPYGWDHMSQRTAELSSEVLKFPHHGGWKGGDAGALLDRVGPQIVVISVGTAGHRYDHPDSGVFDALRARPEIRVLCTQATEKCVADPSLVETRVKAMLRNEACPAHALGGSGGCPCASTVIVSLGPDARVVHPACETHDQVIQENFPLAQCRTLA